MKKPLHALTALTLTLAVSAYADNSKAPSHGIDYPAGWQDWTTIAVSHRTDNKTIRSILGNDIAQKAARAGQVNPWPDGAILGKVVWKDSTLTDWPTANAPGEFVHAEFMFKDAEKYASTGGWGWARWVGLEQQPFDKGTQVCTSCHTPVKNRDWVFTDPARFPE
ncbi:MAG: cytochrome P460 family protein [Gammaproteobacteria bacterium]|nr:cytochrome P460 family protein [Gammaproteobacteria bacterium]MBL6998817.1 cytochrome P460 family protein [Gammaproteobacteria bacterium]